MNSGMDIFTVFEPLVGEIAWSVCSASAPFLTLEFGSPHLSIRHPIIAKPEISPRVAKSLARRHVTIVGDYHLWIQYAKWELNTQNGRASNEDADSLSSLDCLEELDGQILINVAVDDITKVCTLKFDLGAVLQLSRNPEFAEEQWGLYSSDGRVVALEHDGSLVSEAPEALILQDTFDPDSIVPSINKRASNRAQRVRYQNIKDNT